MLERRIDIIPAYDRRNRDGGIHGAEIQFYVIGDEGAIQFIIYTNWHLPNVHKELISKCNRNGSFCLMESMPAEIGYHSKFQRYNGQTPITNSCPIINGKCYYDGSTINAKKYFDIMVSEGLESLWKALEDLYNSTLCHSNIISS